MKRGRLEHNNNNSENQDRLSDLPDCVLLRILSSLNTKHAVQTCILSTRWKNLWKHLPSLALSSSHFRRVKGFAKFVSRVLSLRNDSTSLHTVDFWRFGSVEPYLLKRIVKYAVSHNVQQLDITVAGNMKYFPPNFFSCRTLTSLSLNLSNCHRIIYERKLFPNSLNLPALLTLSLKSFVFCVGNDGRVEPFSALKSLKCLIIDKCEVQDAGNLCISITTLVKLTILMHHNDSKITFGIELSPPSLCSFDLRGIPFPKLHGSKCNLSSIKHVKIDADMAPRSGDTHLVLLDWLVELVNIESLTVSSWTLEVLSLVPDLLKMKLPSLINLKSLKITKYPPIPDGMVDFLLQNSPSAKVDFI